MAAPDIGSTAGMLGSQKSHDVPVENLDYAYIGNCSNAKELEKILKALRSGREGRFPDLEKFTEEKLSSINPKSRILRKEERISTAADVEKEEWNNITSGLEDWTNEMKNAENNLKSAEGTASYSTLPPIRSQGSVSSKIDKKPESEKINPNKRVKPREYREWDKINVEEELAKIDDRPKKEKTEQNKVQKPVLPEQVDTEGLNEKEREMLAVREKDKGNEAFRAGDYGEALAYYNRSLSIIPSAHSYNNRALTHVKLEMWDKAIEDLNRVLAQEPDNIKAFLRRGVAYKGKKEYMKAKKDLQQALALESSNKRAKDLLHEVSQLLAKEEQELKEKKEKGRRVMIEDIEGSEDEEEEIVLKTQEEKSDSLIKMPNDTDCGKKRVIIEEVDEDEDEIEETKKKKVPTATLR